MKIIIMSSAVFYLTAALFHTLNKQKIGYIFHGAGVAANLYLVIYNWVTNGYVPFISMYQVLTFVGVCFTLGCLYMHFVNKDKWMDKYFLLCSGILMIGVFFMQTTDIWYRPPALQSIWFIPHIMCYMIGYPLCAVSFVLCIMRVCSPQVKESHDKDTREKILRIREMRDKGIYDVVRFAFPFMTAGMLLGAIWANEIWSHYWSWDPKENWALITWLLYAIYLHCYRSKSMRKYMYIFIILGIIALIVTMFGINILTKVLGDLGSEHAYS